MLLGFDFLWHYGLSLQMVEGYVRLVGTRDPLVGRYREPLPEPDARSVSVSLPFALLGATGSAGVLPVPPTICPSEAQGVCTRNASTQTTGMIDESVQTVPSTSSTSSLETVPKNLARCARTCESPPDVVIGNGASSLYSLCRYSDDVYSHLGFGDGDGDESPSLAQRRVFADAGAPICLLQPPDPYEFYDDPKKGGHTGFEQWPAEDQEIYDEFENDDIGGNLDDYAIPLLPGPEEPDTVLPKLPVSDRPELCPIQDLCNEFSELFNNKIGFCPLVTHDIKTFDEQPMAQRPRRVPHKWQADIRGQIDDMLREGIIRPSMSPWRSPCVYVKKKTGGVRICVDYRELNRRSHMSAYPFLALTSYRMT
ncbi:retrovirus polyprotein, putative [Perkinsus marinus ATCC 50983]|uniref:Retrovirus polyprotein, putative n=1 Tax=Perkinsus marinus (strain ATCC 50983 / TXsc) TaxID=423536 RepID=C5M0F5_PERM5|nr:retrovirus polyprotein, putative [Perkinsus marinus ATCC 50983]EEQ97537.1 retrovirus polyprotein, putative [Perkinsus marinus ATCC 50983]|eukprot:XP_002764820.1 retrovirus polyprotein, putative [Perkinsus marinus ATCC 50983]